VSCLPACRSAGSCHRPPNPAPAQGAVGAPGPGAPGAQAPGAGAPATPTLLPPKTECLIISDVGLRNSLFARDTPATTGPSTGRNANPKCAEVGTGSGLLSGSGDLTIAVDQKALDTFRDTKRDQPGSFVLFLNGIPMMTDAPLIAHENVGTLTIFRYRISQGKESQLLWSTLYADHGLFTPQPLHAALGWKADTETTPSLIPRRDNTGARVQVTTEAQMILAALLVLLTIGVVIYIGIRGDSLRDADLPAWWLEAATLKTTIAKMDLATRDQHLARAYTWYRPEKAAECQQRAELLLKRQPVAKDETPAVIVGLALLPQTWKPLRASYSLSRTQLALCFTFTVAAGVFLWMLYGDLRHIDGSLLLLLGISVGTAGASWIADRNMPDRPYSPSQGFLSDLLTGFDERKQLHRYQAVIINLVLLVVGVFHVVEQLSYPVFDGSWLIFLGISGSAYGLGKGTIETKP
jgi:hypothetical protein